MHSTDVNPNSGTNVADKLKKGFSALPLIKLPTGIANRNTPKKRTVKNNAISSFEYPFLSRYNGKISMNVQLTNCIKNSATMTFMIALLRC